MRALPVPWAGSRIIVALLPLFLGGVVHAQPHSNSPPATDIALPLVTNLAQLRELSSSEPSTLYEMRLEGNLWWSSSAKRKLVLNDASGTEELEMDLNGEWPHSGERVQLQGFGTIVRKRAGLRLGVLNPLVDNDGVHRSLEKSGSIYLLSGRYPFRLESFNTAGKPGLDLSLEGPEITRQRPGGSVFFRNESNPDGSGTNLTPGLNYSCYEGQWERLPDFNSLRPVKTGTSSGPDGKLRTRANNVALRFTGSFEAPREGVYTFHLKSSDGSRLFLGEAALRATVLGPAEVPKARPMRLGQTLEGNGNDYWAEVEGRLTALQTNNGEIRLELTSGPRSLPVAIASASDFSLTTLLHQWVRAKGFAEPAFAADGQRVVGALLVPSAKEITGIEATLEPENAANPGNGGFNPAVDITAHEIEELPVLLTAGAVRNLKLDEARRGYPVKLRGVVTCVQADKRAFVVQDSTMGLYLTNSTDQRMELPEVGEFLQVEATTVEPGIAKVSKAEDLGAGKLPEPARATWGQLLNGSLDSQWVELSGWVQEITNRPNGWSRLSLHMSSGVLRVDLRRAGVKPGPVDQYNNAVIRLRGCMFADWHPDTLRLKVGQIRMYDVDVMVEQPAVQDFDSIPRQTVTALMRFDPAFDPARRVRVSGQIVFVRGSDYFMMDGKDGIRFLAKEPLGLRAGDLVEAAGFPELSGAAPVLRGAVARKIGQAPLPRPKDVSPNELNNIANDSTLVRVEGLLTRIKHTPDNQVLEMQAGPWRFLAKLKAPDAAVDSFKPGSRLGLVGVYCAQGGYSALGTDVVPLDLLLNSVADIAVLATPPWWTLRRLLVVVGALAAVLVLAVLWITQLRRKVEVRTRQLAEQIKQREHVEHLRAMEQERARIAQDLHDELGSDITEIGMLAARARSISGSDQERSRHLVQMGDKAREMVNALEEIVWAMNPTHNSLASLVSYFSFYAERFLGLASINWELEELPGAANCAVDSRRRHELFLAFREALTNVVRHSGATQVKLAIGAENGEVRLVVTDNGCGLTSSNGNGHLHGKDGIPNMKARIEGLGGRFEILSQNGHGTTVNLRLPAT